MSTETLEVSLLGVRTVLGLERGSWSMENNQGKQQMSTTPPRPPCSARDTKYLKRYQEAMRGMESSLLRKSYPGGLWYVGELNGDTFSPKV